ncbi:hypothetical protein glysoja_043971 [Glycine soja]|uniref:Uncharacterized protein n=1 Tax=Glycine soja TaxID=3848 RepID=A0A0B2QVB6_GLYSO|nr:hypothetical protein glysoja_043971 [Glycine soja]
MISSIDFESIFSMLNHSLNKVFLIKLIDVCRYKGHLFVLCSNGEIQITLLDTTIIFG